jgi:hypothetical protein
MEEDYDNLVCVLCGELWEPEYKNLCECGGFCSWGYEKGGKMLSWGNYDDSSTLQEKSL